MAVRIVDFDQKESDYPFTKGENDEGISGTLK